MAEPIRVDFQVGGIKDVLEAFRTVTKAAKEFGDQVNATAKARSRGNARAKAEGDALSREEAKRAREYDAYYKRLLRERSVFAQRQAITEQRVQTNEAKRAARERARAEEAESRRGALAVVRGFIAAEREKTNEAKRAARERARAEEAESRRGALAIVRGFLNAEKEKTRAAEREERARLRATEVANRAREARAKTIASRIVGSASNAISTVGGTAGMVTGLMGGFTVADSVQKGLDARGAAADLANQSGRKVSSKDILETSSSIATTYGMDTTDVIKGLDAFVAKSGDVVSGLKGLGGLTELSVATGADMRDLLQTAGIIHMGTGDMAETMKRMRVLAGAGREGSVDMRELSQYAGRISAGANQFVSKGAAFAQLSAIVQQAAATGGATAAPEATEAVTRLATDVFEKQEAFAAYGIKTKDASGKYLVDPMQLIKESIVKTGGDSSKLLELFGKMSYRAVAGFQDVYNRAGGGKQGEAAMDEAFKKFMNAELSAATIKQDASDRMKEADKQFSAVLNNLREQVAAQVIPTLVELLPKFKSIANALPDLLKTITDLVKWVAENPFTGLGALVAVKVGEDIAAAAIGATISKAIAAMIAGAGGAAGAAGAGGAAGAAGAGAGGAALSLGARAAGAAYTGLALAAGVAAVGGYLYSRGEKANEGVAKTLASEAKANQLKAEIADLTAKLEWQKRPDAMDPTTGAAPSEADRQGTVRELESRGRQLQTLIGETQSRQADSGGFIERTVMSALGESEAYETKQRSEKALYDSALKDMTTALESLNSFLQRNTGGPGGNTPPMLGPQTTVSMASPLRAGQ